MSEINFCPNCGHSLNQYNESLDSLAVDELYKSAVILVIKTGIASTAILQRKFRIGYSKAAKIIERLEEEGIVGPSDGSKPREVFGLSEDII